MSEVTDGLCPVLPINRTALPLAPFSDTLHLRTAPLTGQHDSDGFMADLITGQGTRNDYIALVGQYFFIYNALEQVADLLAENELASQFITPQLTRLPAIELDLEFLLGASWREKICPLPSTVRYVNHLRTVTSRWAGGFIAHHYTRYLGDLSGGRVIRALMQRQFGFDTNGVGFYLFDQIAHPKKFKETYRAQLDVVRWSHEERERVIAEVLVAYRFTAELFTELAGAKAAA